MIIVDLFFVLIKSMDKKIILMMITNIKRAFQVRPEVVPYSMVLSEEVGYGCWLEIEIIEPISIKHLDEWTREEMKDLFIKSPFEEINPTERNGIFTINSNDTTW